MVVYTNFSNNTLHLNLGLVLDLNNSVWNLLHQIIFFSNISNICVCFFSLLKSFFIFYPITEISIQSDESSIYDNTFTTTLHSIKYSYIIQKIYWTHADQHFSTVNVTRILHFTFLWVFTKIGTATESFLFFCE